MDRQDIQQLCERYSIRGGRALGQNFLCSTQVLTRIMEVANLQPADTVLEIGPGFGVLTKQLAQVAGRVVAVELDRRLFQIATERMANHRNVTVVAGDILTVSPKDLGLPKRFTVVANLPYQITAHLLRQLYGDARFGSRPVHSVLMLQREVAHRIAARPGDHTLLSLSVQLFADVRLAFEVPKINFWPTPKVDSAVVSIRLRDPNPVLVQLESTLSGTLEDAQARLFRLLRQGFSSPRKQLQNTLRAVYLKSLILPAMAEASVDAKARAEDLDFSQWISLAKSLKI